MYQARPKSSDREQQESTRHDSYGAGLAEANEARSTGAFAVHTTHRQQTSTRNKVNRARLIAPFASATRSQPKKRSATKSRPALHPHCLHANAAVAAPTPLPALHSFRPDPGHTTSKLSPRRHSDTRKETRPRRFETPIITQARPWPSPTSPSTAPRRRGASAS